VTVDFLSISSGKDIVWVLSSVNSVSMAYVMVRETSEVYSEGDVIGGCQFRRGGLTCLP
jgi:hypothetical protein